MGFEHTDSATLSFPAVRPEEGEALSSWLARIARAHLLDIDHVADEIGCRVQSVDHAPTDQLIGRIAQRIGASTDVVLAASHPLITPTVVPGHGDFDWRVCSGCLTLDTEQGRALHVRRAWLHPLSTVCLEHHSALTIPTAEEWGQLTTDEVTPPRQDHGLRDLAREPLDSLLRAARLVEAGPPSSRETQVLAREVSDLVDALGVQINYALGRGAILTLFEEPRRGRHIRPLALDLPDGLLSVLDVADRLLFVRAALALRWPSEGYQQERAVLGDWFKRVMMATVPVGRRRVIGDHPTDPLCLLAVALPVQPFHRLCQRAGGWSEDLQRRWASAEQLAALAGLN